MSQETKQVAPLQTDERGLLVGGTFEEQWRIASAYAKSGLVPQSLATPEKVLVAIQFARELGLQPITAMRQICVINGTPSLWGDLPLSLAMKSGQLENIEETFQYDDRDEVISATCTLTRVGIKSPVVRSFSLEDARRAGLLGKGPWKTYPKRMLQCRARSWALKDLFPDMLNGAAIAEFDYNELPEPENKYIPERSTSKLKQILGVENEQTNTQQPLEKSEPKNVETIEAELGSATE